MFRLTREEAERSRSQIAILKSGRGYNVKYLPHAFTEHGAIQAANILSSPRAVMMGIHVVRAFRAAARSVGLEQRACSEVRGARTQARHPRPGDHRDSGHSRADEPGATQAPRHRLYRRFQREVTHSSSRRRRFHLAALRFFASTRCVRAALRAASARSASSEATKREPPLGAAGAKRCDRQRATVARERTTHSGWAGDRHCGASPRSTASVFARCACTSA
jgi:ORF6N domain